MECGVQCVMMDLMPLMQMWHAENWGTQKHLDSHVVLLMAQALVQYGLMTWPAQAQSPLCMTVLTVELVFTTVDMVKMLEFHAFNSMTYIEP